MSDINEMWPEDWPMSAVNEANKLEDKIAELERELAEAMERLAIISNIWHKLDEAIKSAPGGEVQKT